MNISFTNTDESWQLQGRIIPPSVTAGDGCILHMQTKHTSWDKKHFHVGRSPITAEAGLEMVMSLLVPWNDNLICYSFDPEEQANEVEYLHMVRLGHPPDAVAFLTISGLTIVIQIKGLEAMFGPSDLCKACSGSSNIIDLSEP